MPKLVDGKVVYDPAEHAEVEKANALTAEARSKGAIDAAREADMMSLERNAQRMEAAGFHEQAASIRSAYLR